MESYEILWKKTLSELEKIVGSISYDTFFAPIIPVDIVGNKIVLCIDGKIVSDALQREPLCSKLKLALSKSSGEIVDFVVYNAKSREEYLELSRTDDGIEVFHMYYSQFVTPYVTELVRARIGEDRIRASKDVHFNDIPLKLWDELIPCVRHDISVRNEDINGTRCVSMCECVCTMKTAAHIIRNSFND